MEYIDQRISTAQSAVEAAQTSANEETKSSAGDKYETGRSMMQQEAQWGRTQLAEAQKLKQDLDQISIEHFSGLVQPGSLVYTNKGIFFIAISAGRLTSPGEIIFAVSAGSPLGVEIMGKKTGDSFTLNGQAFKILKVT